MENIIKKAIEGGWKEHFGDKNVRMVLSDKTGWWYEWDSEDEYGNPTVLSNPCCYDHIKYQYPLIVNPFFWQCLGKACGWGEFWNYRPRKNIEEDKQRKGCIVPESWTEYHALRFHEINLTEGWGKAVAYLEKLITNK